MKRVPTKLWEREVRRSKGIKEGLAMLTERRPVQLPHLTLTTIDKLLYGTFTCSYNIILLLIQHFQTKTTIYNFRCNMILPTIWCYKDHIAHSESVRRGRAGGVPVWTTYQQTIDKREMRSFEYVCDTTATPIYSWFWWTHYYFIILKYFTALSINELIVSFSH